MICFSLPDSLAGWKIVSGGYVSSVSSVTYAKIAVLLGLLNEKKHKNFWECSGENLDQLQE